MSSAHTLPLAIERCYAVGHFDVVDPGSAGTISWHSKGYAQCKVVTAGAESRALPAASGFSVGQRLLVTAKTLASGDLSITGATGGTVVLSANGDVAEFVVTDANGTKQWRSAGVPTNGLDLLVGAGAAPSASGLLFGGGTTADPSTTAVADAKFIEVRAETTSGTGDNRLAYLQYAFETDGVGGGEAVRARTLVNANIGTAHAIHAGLGFEAAAGGSETSGLGAAVRGTTHIPDVASWAPAGTVYAGMFELYSDGAASDPAGLTELAVLCLSNSGNATGAADVDTDAAVIAIKGFTAAAGVTNAISSTSLAELPASTVGIRVKIGSTIYYIPAVISTQWN